MSGPITKNTTTVPLGLAQIRVGASAANIANNNQALSSSNSIGALANTKFTSAHDYFTLESGFPLNVDEIFCIREGATLECGFKELTPANVALAKGLDPTSYSDAHSGEIKLGAAVTPADVRLEALYTFPDGTNTMCVIFPRAKVTSNTEVDFQSEDVAATAVTFTALRANSDIDGGSAAWDTRPIGKIEWNDA